MKRTKLFKKFTFLVTIILTFLFNVQVNFNYFFGSASQNGHFVQVGAMNVYATGTVYKPVSLSGTTNWFSPDGNLTSLSYNSVTVYDLRGNIVKSYTITGLNPSDRYYSINYNDGSTVLMTFACYDGTYRLAHIGKLNWNSATSKYDCSYVKQIGSGVLNSEGYTSDTYSFGPYMAGASGRHSVTIYKVSGTYWSYVGTASMDFAQRGFVIVDGTAYHYDKWNASPVYSHVLTESNYLTTGDPQYAPTKSSIPQDPGSVPHIPINLNIMGTNTNTYYNIMTTVGSFNYYVNPSTLYIPNNNNPTITATSPSPNVTFSTVQNQMTVSGTVKDTDAGDILTVKYRIDGNAGDAGAQLGSTITANGSDQAYSGSINVGAYSNGTHYLFQWVEDNKGGKSSEYSIPFIMDKTPPSTPTLAANITAPTSTNVTVTISNWGDAATKQYRINGGAWTSYTAPVVIASNCTVEARGIDAVGNISGAGSCTVSNIDKVPPTTPALAADITVPTNQVVTVTISNWGDAATKQYRIDGGSWTAYTAPVVVASNCTVEARGIDAVDNISGVGSCTVSNIDKVPPTTPTIAADIIAPINQDVTVTISNWGDAATKQYRIDGGSWTAYTAPVVVASNCTVEARGIDAAGNISGVGSCTVSNIDKVPPTTPTIAADIIAPTNQDVTVTISNWGDAATKQYRIDGGAWNNYTTSASISFNCLIEARGTDSVGNISGIGSLNISNIDKIAPSTPTLTADKTVPTNQDVTVTISNWGDAATKQYRIDGGTWNNYTTPAAISFNCLIEARGTDSVGNISITANFKVENIFKSLVVTQDVDHDYHFGLTGDLKPGWQYEIIIKDDSDNTEIFNQRYPNITTDVKVLKSYLSSGYSFSVTENILDSAGNVIFSNYSNITKEIDRLEFVSPDLFLYNGQTHQYTIRSYFIDGSVKDNLLEVDWTSSNPDIQVNNMGRVSVNNAGTAIITATGRIPNDSISISITVSCEALSDFDITSNAKSYIIEGDEIQYNVRALLNPTVIDNYTNLTWSVDDSSIATIDQNGKLHTKTDGTVIVTATDNTLKTFSKSFPVIVRAAPTVLENTDNAFVINLAGDLDTGWEYGIKITNVTTSAVIYEQNQPSDTLTVIIPKNNLLEGNKYSIEIDILNGSIINSRTITIRKADTLSPIITRIFIDQGTLYVLAEDNVELNQSPYRFTIISTASIQNVQDIINSQDPFRMQLLIETDRDLNNLCTAWILENNISNVKIQDKLRVEVRDSVNNIKAIEFTVNKTFGTLYGQKTPEEIAAEKSGRISAPPEVTTATEIKKEADTALSEIVAIADESPLNSQTGQITVDLSSVVSSIQSEGSLLKGCRYRLELYKKFTGEIIYSKILYDTTKIVIPDLDDATVYLVKVVIINSKGEEITSKSFEAETADRTPPIITSIKTKKGTFTVSAQDNKSLAQEAYKFEIVSTGILNTSRTSNNEQVSITLLSKNVMPTVGKMVSTSGGKMTGTAGNWNLNTWTSSNTMEGVQTNMIIKTLVRDSTGNTTELFTTVSSLDDEFVNLINADKPLILIPGTTGNLNNYFGMEGDITYTVNDSEAASIDQNGNITALKNGQVIVTARDNNTGAIRQLLIKLKNLNTTNVRRIIVEKESITNLKYLYSDYLLNIFGTTEGLTWISRDIAISDINNTGELKAIDYGVSKVSAVLDDKTFSTYVVVVKPGTVKSDIQEIFVKAPYLIKLGKTLDLNTVSEFIDFADEITTKSEFVVYESSDYSVVEISGDKLIASGEGITDVIAFDLINNVIEKVKIMVEDMSPEPLNYKDIDKHWAREEIESGTKNGIAKGYEDGNFNPDYFVTNNEFLIMLSRTMLASDDSSRLLRTDSYKGLNPESQYYNNYAYALNNVNALFAYDVFGGRMEEENIITRGEVAEIILSYTKGALTSEAQEYNIKDIEGQPHESALRYCLDSGIYIGCGDGTVQGNRGLTRAEMLVIMNRLYGLNSLTGN